MKYEDWLAYRSNLAKRDVSKDEQEYDLKGYFNSVNSTPADPDYDPVAQKGQPYNGHLPDDFKLPNHPTFSDQSKYHVPVIQHGGHWEGNEFTPSQHNIENMGPANLQSYFNEVESPEALNYQGLRQSALRKVLGK